MERRAGSHRPRGEGDISHDGRRIATFRMQDNRTVLAILERDGLKVERVKQLPALAEFGSPRWSPDDRWIAFVGAIEIAFNRAVYVMDAGDGEPKAVAHAQNIQGSCLAARQFGPGVCVLGGQHHDLSAGLQPANRLEGRRA